MFWNFLRVFGSSSFIVSFLIGCICLMIYFFIGVMLFGSWRDEIVMGTIVGFSLYNDLEDATVERLLVASKKALSNYTHIVKKEFTLGAGHLIIWGHTEIIGHCHTMPDGSFLVLIGSPYEPVDWLDVQEKILLGKFSLPWDGRLILLRVSEDGTRWTIWNDWLGSIPVYHAGIGQGRVASTLEPVIVAAAGYTPNDFFMPGLVSLLLNGHFISDWTLYKAMKVIPPDSKIEWDENGFRSQQLGTVQPSQNRWEAGWDDLVDEMYELSRSAIVKVLKSQPEWVLTLSSGLDSRLIAGVAAEVGARVNAYAWGDINSTDVNFSWNIAHTLGIPWKHIHLKKDYLTEYTPRWASLFGSSMSFHGMYQMCFFDALGSSSNSPVLSGFMGDVISGDGIGDTLPFHAKLDNYQMASEWYSCWQVGDLRAVLKAPHEEALEMNRHEIKNMIDGISGAFYQKMVLLEAWNRQRMFTSFQTVLKDYWGGVGTPYLNREYARFCLSLPRAVMDERRLMADVFRRYFGKLAVIPGTYAKDPYILTGRYLILRRLAKWLRPVFHRGPLRGFGNVQLRLDTHSVRATGKAGLWPLFENLDQLAEWFDVDQLEKDYRMVTRSIEDIRPLRRLQAVQTLAYRLM